MVQNLNDVAPNTGVFEKVERREEKKNLVDKSFEIVAFSSEMTGADGQFHVLLCRDGAGLFTTTANDIIMKRVKKAASVLGLKENEGEEGENYLLDSVAVKLIEAKSTTSGRNYFALE